MSREPGEVHTNVGINVLGPDSICELTGCEISGGGAAVKVDSSCELRVEDSILFGGSCCAIDFDNAVDSIVVGSSILPGTGIAVRSFRNPGYGEAVHDLRNNFWGTEDGEEIRALILDGADDPNNASTVLYEPFVGGPVATKDTTLDGIKAMFR